MKNQWSISTEQRRENAAKGGRVAHAHGTAHEWQVGEEAAREAGRKGGKATARYRKVRALADEINAREIDLTPPPDNGVVDGVKKTDDNYDDDKESIPF